MRCFAEASDAEAGCAGGSLRIATLERDFHALVWIKDQRMRPLNLHLEGFRFVESIGW